MKSKNSNPSLRVVAAGVLLALAAAAQAADPAKRSAAGSQPAAAQVDRAGGVTVKVTPRSLAKDAAVWEFAVVLETHSVDLADDLVRSSVLIDSQGQRHAPLAWEGAGPGGHHRTGVLKFKPLAQAAGPVVLQMSGVGGVAERTFRWQLD